jgi:hypothetical protein
MGDDPANDNAEAEAPLTAAELRQLRALLRLLARAGAPANDGAKTKPRVYEPTPEHYAIAARISKRRGWK